MTDLTKLTDIECLILTIIGEARGEPIEGQVAVGYVIKNRSLTWGKPVKEICLQPKQFSCWNSNDPNRALLDEIASNILIGLAIPLQYRQCQCVALGIARSEILDNTHGALNYITLELWDSPNRPTWAKGVNFAISKGTQIFFTANNKESKSNDSSITKA